MTTVLDPREWSPSRRSLGVVGMLLVAIGSPSSNILLFDGLPLDEPVPFLAGLALLPLIFSRDLRAAVFEQLGAGRSGLLLAAILTALALKIAALHAPQDGFEACYGSPGRTPLGECEFTYAGVRVFPGATRIDAAVDFGPIGRTSGAMAPNPYLSGALIGGVAETDWNLSYLNALRFNVYETPGDGASERLPLRVRWRGTIDNATSRSLEVTIIGSLDVVVEGETWTMQGQGMTPARSVITLPAGRRHIELLYSYPGGATLGPGRPDVPFATISLRYLSAPGGESLAEPFRSEPVGLAWRILAFCTDLLVLAAVATLLFVVARVLHETAPAMTVPWLLAAVVYVATHEMPELGIVPFGVACVLAFFLAGGKSFPASRTYLALALLAFAVTAGEAPSLAAVVYRRPGSDWQTYESFARDVIIERSLRAGEDVFHYQPGFRYLLFGLRVVTGDNDVLLFTLARLATVWPLAWLYLAGSRAERRAASTLCAGALAAAAILLMTSRWVQSAIVIGVSEWTTWALLPGAVGLIFLRSQPAAWTVGASMLACSALVRVNQLPGIALVILAGLMKNGASRRAWVAMIAPFVVAAVLIPAHNLRYGGRAELLPTERGDPDVFAVHPAEIARVTSDATVPDRLLRQVRQLAFVDDLPAAPTAVARIGWLLYAGWIACSVLAVVDARRGLGAWRLALALAPIGYLGPFLLIKNYNFYPRHLVIGVLAACVSAMVLVSTRQPAGSPES